MKYTAILKLKQMLDEAKIPYQSFDDDFFGEKKIHGDSKVPLYPAYCLCLNDDIDVVEHCGSYGNEQDLLEIQGALTMEERERSSVLGHLTAEEVFKRFKYCYEHNTTVYSEDIKEKDTIHSHVPKFKKDIPMPPVKPAPTTNCNKELKMRENELHEPKIETEIVASREYPTLYRVNVVCPVCYFLLGRGIGLTKQDAINEEKHRSIYTYCPLCGARLKEVKE